MFIRDRTKSGDACLRHENYKTQTGYTISNRRVEFANAIIAVNKYGHPIHRDSDRDTVGDIQGGTYIKPKGRPIGSWWHGCPVIKKGNGFKPIRNRNFQPDDDYDFIDAAVQGGEEVPEDTTGIVYAASKEDGEQELIFVAGNAGIKLLAPNRNGPYEQGTDVYDIGIDGKPDEANFAKLQSAWIPMSPGYAPTSGSSGGAGNNFFAGAAVGVFGTAPNGVNLIPAQSPNAGGGVNVGILPDGAGGLLFNGQTNPFSPNIGIGVQGNLNFTQVEGDQGGFNPTSGLSGGGINLPLVPGGGSVGGGGGQGVVSGQVGLGNTPEQNAALIAAWNASQEGQAAWQP